MRFRRGNGRRVRRYLVPVAVTVQVMAALATFSIAQAAQKVLILTDNSGASGNGASHVSDLIAAFAGTGAAVTTNTAELTNNSTMALPLVTGWDVVIVVTVSGQAIDAADVATLQTAVNTRASGAFMFFTDACQGCTIASAQSVLPIVNGVAGWSAGLGLADNSNFSATLNGTGPHNTEFANLPSIQGTAYSPLTGIPASNVLYTSNAPIHPGPMAAIAPSTGTSACVFMSTDVTPFWVAGGIPAPQAHGLAQDYLATAASCPCSRVNARVLILTDNSGAANNGASHVSDLIAAFTATGASVATNTTELTNNSAMVLSLVTGWDVVIVVTVTGQPIDAADVSTLQTAVNTRASDAFMFFTDACQGCTVASAQSVLPIVNGVTGSWTAGLGLADNSSFSATMNSAGPYSVAFANQPSIQSAAYSPLTGVPAANVLYTSNAPIHPGPMAAIAPRIATPACVFMTTDVTEFWVTGGIPLPQAKALARDYLNTAMSAPCKLASPRVLILTDNSAAAGNGASHVSDLIAAFAGTGAAVTTNTSELTNTSAMALSLVTGWDVVIVVTVSGQPIDAADVATLQTAVDTRASGAFMFFTDACQGCAIASAQSILPIVNHIAGWSAGLGPADNSTFAAALNSAGPHNTEFANLPSIQGTAYSPMTGVPALYVLYTANAPNHPGPMAAIAPGTDTSACVFVSTDVTPFWVTGGISPAQASGLAQDYMNTVMSCPCTRANQITVGVPQLQEKDHQFSLLIDNNPLVRGVARMRFVLDRRGLVDLRIYDVGGRFIAPLATGSYEAGEHLVTWNATDRSGRAVPSGIYSVRIRVAGEIQSKAIVVIR